MDDRTRSEKVSFIRNTKDKTENIFIQKYVFRFFQSKDELVNNKDSLNIVYPDASISSLPSPRFESYKFLLPEYIALFLNQEKIPSELRSFLLGSLTKTTFQSLDATAGKLLNNPFFTDDSILPKDWNQEKLTTIMKNLGYFKKDDL